MSSEYRIEKPCAYTVDGVSVVYRKTGAVVTLADDVAAGLGDAVRALHPAKVKRAREPKTPAAVEEEAASEAEEQAEPVEEGDGQ